MRLTLESADSVTGNVASPPHCGCASPNPLRAQGEQEAEEEEMNPFFLNQYLAGTSHLIFSSPGAETYTIGSPSSQAFRLGGFPPALLGPQPADNRLWTSQPP